MKIRIKVNPSNLPEAPYPAAPVINSEPIEPQKPRRGKRYTVGQIKVIYEMRTAGKTYREIADQIGRSKEAVRKFCRSEWGLIQKIGAPHVTDRES
jgi:hypothetical protein